MPKGSSSVMKRVIGKPMGWKWAEGLVMWMLKDLSSVMKKVTRKPMGWKWAEGLVMSMPKGLSSVIVRGMQLGLS